MSIRPLASLDISFDVSSAFVIKPIITVMPRNSADHREDVELYKRERSELILLQQTKQFAELTTKESFCPVLDPQFETRGTVSRF